MTARPAGDDVGALAGFTVAVTAERRREELAALLQRRGARVVTASAITIVPLPDDDARRAATEACVGLAPHLVVATTGFGFRGWLEAAEGWGLGDSLRSALPAARLIARGPKPCGAIRDGIRELHAWIMSLLYIGTFGSFIGFGFAFGQVLQVQFTDAFSTPVKAAYLTFLGPLLGSLVRPVGGALADRLGGARVTFCTFVSLAAGAAVVLVASQQRSLPLYLIGFIALFVFSGIGNGSTYKMIPAVFRRKYADDRDARRISAAVIGIAGATGAFGGVLVNLAFRQSFLAFIAFYVLCVVVTWTIYLRACPTRV